MLPTIPPDAPAWVPTLFYVALCVFGALFAVLSPRLKSMLTSIAPPAAASETTMRLHGPALGPAFDGVKLSQELERIADGIETIAEAAKTIARMEEQGTARMLESVVDQLKRLDQKVDGRP